MDRCVLAHELNDLGIRERDEGRILVRSRKGAHLVHTRAGSSVSRPRDIPTARETRLVSIAFVYPRL